MNSSAPAPPSSCSASSRSATLAAALVHGPALAGLGLVGAYVTPLIVSTGQAELLGALHLSRGRHRRRLRAGARADVALACRHRDRVRPVLDAAGSRPARQDRRRRAFLPRRRGLCAGRDASSCPACCSVPMPRPARSTRCRRAPLAAYLFGALLIVLMSRHDTAGADRLCRAHRRHGRDRVAQRSRGRRGAARAA